MTDSYYRQLGDGRFESTILAQGAWNPAEQHMAPVSGLIAHCLEQHEPRPDMRMARISYEILGMIPGGEFDVTTTTIRPGRTIELIQAEMSAGGRTAVRATAWRLIKSDTAAVAAFEDKAMPGVEQAVPWDGMDEWPGGYIASLDIRVIPGHRRGSGQAWIRSPYRMIEGFETTDFVHLLGLIDTANGVSSRVPPGPGSFMFPNLDLQMHLYRQPSGELLGLDTSVTFAADGVGLTSTILNDADGPFGRAEQILTVRQLPAD